MPRFDPLQDPEIMRVLVEQDEIENCSACRVVLVSPEAWTGLLSKEDYQTDNMTALDAYNHPNWQPFWNWLAINHGDEESLPRIVFSAHIENLYQTYLSKNR